MRREFFESILNIVVNHDHYFARNIVILAGLTFVKSFSHPDSAKKKLFLQRQESYRKDVERAFGILQAQWAIVREAARLWHIEDLHLIMWMMTNQHMREQWQEMLNISLEPHMRPDRKVSH